MVDNILGNITSVVGICPHCKQRSLLLSLVQDYYKCTTCDEDIQQYVNGHIKYLPINQTKKDFLRRVKENG